MKLIDENTRKSAGFKISQQIQSLPQWKNADQIFSFMPMNTEPDISILNSLALEKCKSLYLPRIANGEMQFFSVTHDILNNSLEKHPLGFFQPDMAISGSFEFFNLSAKSIILVPGLAFSRRGDRLGRNGGYYDRFLKQVSAQKEIETCGICFSLQLQEDIPIEPHDMRVSYVVTEKEIIDCKKY